MIIIIKKETANQYQAKYGYNNKKRNLKPIPIEMWIYILIPILNILFLLGIIWIN